MVHENEETKHLGHNERGKFRLRTDGDTRSVCGAGDVERSELRGESRGVNSEDVDRLPICSEDVDEAV